MRGLHASEAGQGRRPARLRAEPGNPLSRGIWTASYRESGREPASRTVAMTACDGDDIVLRRGKRRGDVIGSASPVFCLRGGRAGAALCPWGLRSSSFSPCAVLSAGFWRIHLLLGVRFFAKTAGVLTTRESFSRKNERQPFVAWRRLFLRSRLLLASSRRLFFVLGADALTPLLR
jgi:hypothetical protein